MKGYIFILFLFILSSYKAQQTIELCLGESQSFTYFSTTTTAGTNEWEVGGEYFYTEDLTYVWSELGSFNINLIRYDNCPSEPVTYTVSVIPCDDLFYWVPNTFTPNGDEVNNLWGPIFGGDYDPFDFNLLIFNRWGNIVWESNDHGTKWDGNFKGKKCHDGVYIWKITFGKLGNADKIIEHGHLTLLR
tara:strand:- start:1387 stop:1953 length:567 start_codon:yes stop_codon:yes gene_type:complete